MISPAGITPGRAISIAFAWIELPLEKRRPAGWAEGATGFAESADNGRFADAQATMYSGLAAV